MRNILLSMLFLFTISTAFAMENKMTHPKVKLTTSLGNITIQLNSEKAPISSENF